jgi:hypothetical protein
VRRDFIVVQEAPQRLRVRKCRDAIGQRFDARRQARCAVAVRHDQFFVTPSQARFQVQFV